MRLLIVLALLLGATLAPPASACSATTSPATAIPLAVETFYVGTDQGDFYVYQEDNNMPGLQRWDSGRDDTCGGTAADPDVFLFVLS